MRALVGLVCGGEPVAAHIKAEDRDAVILGECTVNFCVARAVLCCTMAENENSKRLGGSVDLNVKLVS
jgi:hypothetical protein